MKLDPSDKRHDAFRWGGFTGVKPGAEVYQRGTFFHHLRRGFAALLNMAVAFHRHRP